MSPELHPDAIVPSREQLIRYWKSIRPTALTYLARRPLKLVRHERGITLYHEGALPSVPKSVHQLVIEKREGGTGTRTIQAKHQRCPELGFEDSQQSTTSLFTPVAKNLAD